ncbi:uncharacterized protein [Dermacentor albipictus]|uniref:uncharacterized protein isoform X5 n=1 Tax=Dermacentor albipictus TaxID=60249 RepID=UPI0038FBEBBC
MAALILASSLFSAVTTFYNRNTIEETLLSWLRSPSVEVWLGETATEVIAALIKKGHAAANQKEVVSALTWSDAVLLMLSGFVLGFCCGWYFRGPRTATPITAQPLQQLVVQNIIQVDRLQQAIIRGRRRSASQPACHRRRPSKNQSKRGAPKTTNPGTTHRGAEERIKPKRVVSSIRSPTCPVLSSTLSYVCRLSPSPSL